ncbi:conserved hypothetical protein [Candidatus Methylobacter favarea]|uniref:DUF1289 domain-containing protein n=1 Tax=Candidatus Methylobacter favarea TaxID=2707345 RepID=A0A8S0WQ64_9GAMM|nr:DUF1289 domain-containing protein [Candidatus Methylobacter favarea]CAA9891255.1 conserved hypothetical protein [Candidatus Methylobacter favarea]
MNSNRGRITSPCIRNCCLNEDNICLGCFRSLTEIISWTQADNETLQKILNNAEQRRQKHKQKSFF